MDIPDDLDVWTFDTVRDIVRHHDFEPGRFDYKEVLNPSKELMPTAGSGTKSDVVLSIRKTVCSMANTNGGFILFGVADREKLKKGASKDELIVGIPLGGDLRKEFGNKLSDIVPEIPDFKAIPNAFPLKDGARGIYVVQIPPSARRPHMVRSQGVYYRRGEGGSCDPMDHYVVREQMLHTEERLRKVHLFRLYIKRFLATRGMLLTSAENGTLRTTLTRFDTGSYMPLLADIWDLMPSNDPARDALFFIPTQADQINRALDHMYDSYLRWEKDGPGPISPEYVTARLEELRGTCAFCEERLELHFGPLG